MSGRAIIPLLCAVAAGFLAACSTIPNRSSMTQQQVLAVVDKELERVKEELPGSLDWTESREGTVSGCEGLSGPTEWYKLHRVFVAGRIDEETGRAVVGAFDELWSQDLERFRADPDALTVTSLTVVSGKFAYGLAFYPVTNKLTLSGTTPCIRE